MKNKKIIFFILLALLIAVFAFRPSPAGSEVICIDADGDGALNVLADGTGECATIQDAIDSAEDGGSIQLGDGTYQETVNVSGTYVSITGNVDDPSMVVIDANYEGRAFYFDNAEGGISELSGMTIINGRGAPGGAIYVYTAALTVSDCVFYNHDSTNAGGAINFYNLTGDSLIETSRFYSNNGVYGGAIAASYLGDSGRLIIANNVFYNNTATEGGGAIYAGLQAHPAIYNNTFAYNTADTDGGGVYIYEDNSALSIKNNIFYDNEANDDNASYDGGGLYIRAALSDGVVDYNAFYINTPHNVYTSGSAKAPESIGSNNTSVNPLFTDVSIDDYTLLVSSPMIDAGEDLSSDSVITDIVGNSRPQGVSYDIGAYEYTEEVAEETPSETTDEGITDEPTDEEAPSETTDEGSTDEPTDESDTSSCGDFPDVDAADFTDEQCRAIEWVKDNNIFTGGDYTGELAPADPINRAETTKVLIQSFFFETDDAVSTYDDTEDGEWYTPYIMAATREGIVAGYGDGNFYPSQTVNKVEMLKIILETANIDLSVVDIDRELFTDIPVTEETEWYRPYAYYAYDMGLVDATEGGEFGPADDILREDVILVLYRLYGAGLWSASADEGSLYINYVFYDGSVVDTESDEYVEITNSTSSAVNLEGYYIMGSSGDEVFTFPSYELGAGEVATVYTNQGDLSFGSESALWNNDGETVYLYDAGGVLTDSYTY